MTSCVTEKVKPENNEIKIAWPEFPNLELNKNEKGEIVISDDSLMDLANFKIDYKILVNLYNGVY